MNLTVGEMPPPFGAIVMMDNSRFEVNLDIDEIDRAVPQISFHGAVGQDVLAGVLENVGSVKTRVRENKKKFNSFMVPSLRILFI